MQCEKNHITDKPVSLAGLLREQVAGEDEERSEAAVGGEDLPEEDAAGAHFAPTWLVHRLCGACHPSKQAHSNVFEVCGLTNEPSFILVPCEGGLFQMFL